MYPVQLGAWVAERIAAEYGPQRSSSGRPSEWDFWSGPLQAALLAFRDFDSLPYDDVPAVRRFTTPDPVFGAIVFVGVLSDDVVEIADYGVDPDYWRAIDDEPYD